MPTLRPEIHSFSGVKGWLRQLLTGEQSVSLAEVSEGLPDHISGFEGERVQQPSLLATNFAFGKSYFVQVHTQKHIRIHRWLTRWRNRVYRQVGLDPVFDTFPNAHTMAQYQYNAMEATFTKGGSAPEPVHVGTIGPYGVVVTDFITGEHEVNPNAEGGKALDYLLKTLVRMHETGFVHGDVGANIIRKYPSGEPYLVNPTAGVVTTDDYEASFLQAAGFDIAWLLEAFVINLGAYSTVQLAQEVYDDDILQYATPATNALYGLTNADPTRIQQLHDALEETVGDPLDDEGPSELVEVDDDLDEADETEPSQDFLTLDDVDMESTDTSFESDIEFGMPDDLDMSVFSEDSQQTEFETDIDDEN